MAVDGDLGRPSLAFNLKTAARPNILALKPYSDYKDDGTNVLLDANENAYGPALALDSKGKLDDREDGAELNLKGLNRYPDPHQHELKDLICKLRNDPNRVSEPISPSNLFVGVGSDEAIDALIRCFCVPGTDKLLTCPPTYGMYAVSAQTNDVEVVHVPLIPNLAGANSQSNPDTADFRLDVDGIYHKLSQDPSIKLIYLTSPGNPTASLLSQKSILNLLEHPTYNGIICVDEAYIDFSPPSASLAALVTQYPNLVVMQTLSKAFGLAGIRLGAAFASSEVAQLLNNMKAPYNVSEPTSQIATRALQPDGPHMQRMHKHRQAIVEQRTRLIEELPKIPGIGRFRGGFAANFLLVEVLNQPKGKPDSAVALRVYERLAEHRGVVVRFRGKEHGCEGCLRVTVGTETEVTKFLTELRGVLQQIYDGAVSNGTPKSDPVRQKQRESEENAVLA
ncbi:MAG: hypothetical protein Q9159_000642 [Coniocarpon cinnabarinum]